MGINTDINERIRSHMNMNLLHRKEKSARTEQRTEPCSQKEHCRFRSYRDGNIHR